VRRRKITVQLPHQFTARPYQGRFMDFYDHGGRNGIFVWHRRAGKDLVALHQIVKMAMKQRGMYWHCLPSYAQARKAVWNNFNNTTGERLLRSVLPKEIVRHPEEFRPQGEMLIELINGSMIQLIGSDSIDNIVGAGPRHVTFSEFALCKPNSYDLVRPMLRENGGSVAFITTPRGKNHAWKIWEMAGRTRGWMRDLQTLDDTEAWRGWRKEDSDLFFGSAQEVIDVETAAGMQPELARQEYRCDFEAALVGSVWGDLLETIEKSGRICKFEPSSARPVFVHFDLGRNDSTAIWIWQVNGDEIDVLYHYESHGKGLSHYFEKVDAALRDLGLQLNTIWLPHDASADTLVSDLSIEDQFIERYGPVKVKIVPKLSALDGIQAGRWLLQQKVRFHARCAEYDGIEALKQYHYEFDEVRHVFTNRPEHDWSSHTADAFRYLAVTAKIGKILARDKVEPLVKASVPRPVYKISMDELWEWREQDLRRQRRFS
jgi:hypothetical protein